MKFIFSGPQAEVSPEESRQKGIPKMAVFHYRCIL